VEVREMRNAETILAVIRERGAKGLPLERVYRLLFNADLYLRAYGHIASNRGAMTPGATDETADGMSPAKIEAIIDALRHERFRWTPVRRMYIEKKGSMKKRPLGLPTWSDKLLQEVIRSILDAYYEPQFSDHSHGFRPKHGCHTALLEIDRTWRGTAWFIEGDISQCFDRLDHKVLLTILAEKIHDGRFLRLISELLRAGYLENWKLNKTLSGTPQGGIASPILANIYLDRLDKFVECTLLPEYNRGIERQRIPTYNRMKARHQRLQAGGRREEAKRLRKQIQAMPSRDPQDPNYRRLRYIRYADDWLLGFCGPRSEAEEIKARIAEFLREHLKLELSEAKTLITHARTQAARFLGYEVVVHHNTTRRTKGQRSLNGSVGLRMPRDVVKSKAAPYMRYGKPMHRMERSHDSPFSIVEQHQAEYRGLVEYYRMAYNLHRLNYLKWIMETSMTKTLARKLRISVRKVYKRFRNTLQAPDGPHKVLQVKVERPERPPLVATWGNISLAHRKGAILDDQPRQIWNKRTELEQRLVADVCELCGSDDAIEVHHVRALKDLRRRGRAIKPEWVRVMAARHRKTLVVCRTCHMNAHHGCL